jgi:trehalose 6-phosphate phosphatase
VPREDIGSVSDMSGAAATADAADAANAADATNPADAGLFTGPVLPEPPPLTLDCALFLDIDGTLIELAPTPEDVKVDQAISALLPALSFRLGGAVALITGRTIDDAQKLFPTAGLLIAGQHGLERQGSDGRLHLHTERPAGFGWLAHELRAFVSSHEGLLLEDKGATLAVHYRLAPNLGPLVDQTLRHMLDKSGVAGADWHLQHGKSVVEIKPAGRDKGAAILDYMAEETFERRLPVFVGDDLTDEYGFAAVQMMNGRAVKVGTGPTRAHFRLPDVLAVRRWLAQLLRQPSIHGGFP